MLRRSLLALAAALVVAVPGHAQAPKPHIAVTCADFPNQAAAQRAHNTRDADGDGIYCESLPCPCSAAWHAQHGGGGTAPAPPPSTFSGRCKRGILPDRSCSPGKVATTDLPRICTPGYAGSVRNVSETTKDAVYREYGIRHHSRGQYEIDHIVSLELGGSNSIKNLYPEAAAGAWGYHLKDKLENRLHALVCSGQLKLQAVQQQIAANWLTLYHHVFG